MRCDALMARFWLRRRTVSQSESAHSQTRKHWGREWLFLWLMDYVEDIAFLSDNVLEAQGLLNLVKEACNNIGLVLDDKKGNS